MVYVSWIVLGVIGAAVITIVAGRLLGTRRGWVALALSGVAGWTAGALAAGEVTDWAWGSLDMALLTVALGTLFTMAIAVGLDLIAPVGSLHRGAEAGLVTIANPVRGAREAMSPVRRYREVLRYAREEGVAAPHADGETLPAGVRRTLERAGGVFVKLGQVASTRTDLLPRDWCDELGRLRSTAEPQPESVMRTHLEAELGAAPDDLFAEFEWEPVASASIAQLYRARLADSTPVAVKVQRPGLDRTLQRDRAAILQLARLVERRTTLGLSMQPAELAEEFLSGVAEELDFRIEVANAQELAAGLADSPGIRVPVVFPELSGRRVLVEEFVEAPSIGDAAAVERLGLDRRALADRLIESFLDQIFRVGVFHADPHPGNILVEPDGTIVLIDLGAVGRVGPGHRDAVLEILAAASAGEATSLRQALTRITVLDRRVDLRMVDAALEVFLGRHLRAGGGITTAAFEDLAMIIGHFGIRLPRWFATLSRTMVTLEGTLTAIDPEFSLVDAARAHAEQSGMTRPSPSRLRDALEREAIVQLPRLRRLPERLDEILGQATSGRLSARVSVLADEHDERLVTRLVDRIVLGLIASATGIGSVMLLGVEAGPTLGESISLNEVLGYAGLGAASVLALRVIAGIVRDGEV